MIPAETLLDIFFFVDCESVVALQLANKSLLRLCSHNLGILPCKAYKIDFYEGWLYVKEIARRQTTVLQHYEANYADALTTSIGEAEELIGHLRPTDCCINLDDVPVSLDELLRLLPSLRRVPHVTLYGLQNDLLATMRNFDGLRHFSADVPYDLDWRMLRLPIFLNLRCLALFVENNDVDAQIDRRVVEDELTLYCSEMTSFGAAGRRTVWVQHWNMSRQFVDRMIQVVSKKATVFSAMFSTGEHPLLSEEEFSVKHIDFAERHLSLMKRTSTYTSKKDDVRVLVEDYSYENVISFRIAVTNDPHPLSHGDIIDTAQGYNIC